MVGRSHLTYGLRAWAPAKVDWVSSTPCDQLGEGEMGRLQMSATFPRIEPDKLAEFKMLAGEILEIVRGEEGTLQFAAYSARKGVARRYRGETRSDE